MKKRNQFSEAVNQSKALAASGITLIALVVTIIVLLILAGVSLRLIAGGDGIIGKAEKAVNEYTNASKKELEMLNELEKQIEDYNLEIVTAKQNQQEVEIRKDDELGNYFVLNERIKDDVKSIVYVDESDENKQVSNTNELIGGEHVIKCRVLLNNGKEGIATTKLLVGKIVYISGPTNVDEYQGQELSIIGTTADSTITTSNSNYWPVSNNLNLYNLTINAPAISIGNNGTEIRLKNCKLNLSGYVAEAYPVQFGIMSGSWVTDQKMYFDNCEFLTENSKIFASFSTGSSKAYIKSNCTPSELSEFSKYTYTGREEWIFYSISN